MPKSTASRVSEDSFSNPLGMLSSINIYAADDAMQVVSSEDGLMTLQVSLGAADVRAGWSRETTVDVDLAIDTTNFKITSYVMDWKFDPADQNVCRDYRVEARLVDYGAEFVLPDTIRDAVSLPE